jgi:hypothetical protein
MVIAVANAFGRGTVTTNNVPDDLIKIGVDSRNRTSSCCCISLPNGGLGHAAVKIVAKSVDILDHGSKL